uniref:Kinesin-like protein 6 n=1 Tax=Lygus hesperus TaxID=30085 RepID=A0A0A9XI94_LYGHE
MSSSKKLKMERLSPIPMMNRPRTNLSDSSPWCATPKASLKKRKDRYAIESMSSPEVDMQPASSQKFRKTRNSSVRNRIKSVSKKHASIPLHGLIARKAVSHPSRELPTISDSPTSSGLNPPGHSDYVPSQSHIEELQTIDEELDHMPQISAFNSLKRKVQNPLRHSEIFSASLVFPSVQPSTPSNHTPLSGIITKMSAGHNRSLNDSISILMNADVDMCEDTVAKPDEPDAILSSIECFESPGKLPPAKCHDAKGSLDRSSIVLREQISKQKRHALWRGTTSKFNSSEEMCGSERKKRKRALDFNVLTFPVTESESPEDDIISPVSPHLLSQIKDLKCPLPHVDEVFSEESEGESVIEGTPKSGKVSNVVKDDTLSGFTACSSLAFDAGTPPFENFAPIIAHYSPTAALQPKLEILEEASNDAFSGMKCDLNLVCQDTSSDESEVECSIIQNEDKSCFTIPNVPDVVQGTCAKSPPLNFNFTRAEIRPYESPCKTTKPFSEAINIGAFGSPDSNASDNEPEEVANRKEEEDDIINVTTTQNDDEFVEESEQIRPNKRRKKGSLLERASFIISRIDASNTLFDYEIKAGLRPSTGKFVSSPLVVCKKWASENAAHFLVCKSLKYCKIDSQRRTEVAGRTSIVLIMANKISKELSEGSVVVLHYPSTVVYCHSLRIPCILAGNQLVLDSSFDKFSDSHALEINDALIEVLNRPMKNIKNHCSPSTMKVFPFCSIKNLADASLSQCLVDEFELSLRVLHVVKNYSDPTNKKIHVLCADMEEHYCWIQFTEERDVKRATALEALHILADGVLIQVRGFHVFDRLILDKKTKNLLSYVLNGTVKSDPIFILTPVETTWVIPSSGVPRDAKKIP